VELGNAKAPPGHVNSFETSILNPLADRCPITKHRNVTRIIVESDFDGIRCQTLARR
jgi:hypothetical protein